MVEILREMLNIRSVILLLALTTTHRPLQIPIRYQPQNRHTDKEKSREEGIDIRQRNR